MNRPATPRAATRRLFLAIELPEAVRQALVQLQKGGAGVRWSSTRTMHLTLRFLGDTPLAAIGGLQRGLRDVAFAPFELVVDRLGGFGRRPQPVLWAGLAPSPQLSALHDRVDGVLETVLGLPRERRYSPHITLGRMRDGGLPMPEAFAAGQGLHLAFPVDGFTLFASELRPAGAVHTALARYPAAPKPEEILH